MKITFDGITIDDAKLKEAADFVRMVRGSKGYAKSSTPGMFKLPKEVADGRDGNTNFTVDPWTREELVYIVKNMNKKPKELAQSKELAGRGLPAISARKSAIKSGLAKRMGHAAYEVYQELGGR